MTHRAHKEGAVSPHGERDVGKDPLGPLGIVELLLRNTEEHRGKNTVNRRTYAGAITLKTLSSPGPRTTGGCGKS